MPEPSEERSEALEEALGAKATELTAKDPKDAEIGDIKSALELAGEAQKLGLDELADKLIDWAKDALNALGEKALSKVPCSAEIEDVKNALELAGEAQKLGLDELADKLIDWAKDGLRSVASRRISSGASEKEKLDLAAAAQGLGLDELANDILEGREITPAYTYSAHAEHTEQIVDLEGVVLRTDHLVVDAHTCDVHFGWKGKISWTAIGFDGSTSTDELAISFDADGVVIWPWAEGVSVELGTKMIDENAIVFTVVLRAPGLPDWVVVFPPAEIVRVAPESS